MRFLSVRELRSRSAAIWRDLPKEKEMVVTSNGRPVAILTSVADSDLEDSLRAIRQARAIQAVSELQRASLEREADKLTLDEVNAEIAAARGDRVR